ncbi:putative CmcJ-like methyltransferase, partial [Bombardia bombarda]
TDSIESGFYFLERNDTLYSTERPYTFKFPPSNGFPMSNLKHDKVNGIRIDNVRGREDEFQIEKQGFTVLKIDNELQYKDSINESDPEVMAYLKKMEGVLKEHLKASRVQVFHGTVYQFDQPTTAVHIRRQFGDEADALLRKRYQWINFWKPLRGPVNDWPLVLCDSSLVDPRRDLEIADLLYPNLATENSYMYYRPGLKWYFLSDHSPDEVLVFKQMDSLKGACPG